MIMMVMYEVLSLILEILITPNLLLFRVIQSNINQNISNLVHNEDL